MTPEEDKALRACGQVIGILAALGMPAIQAAPHLTKAFNELMEAAIDALTPLLDDDGNLMLSTEKVPA